MNRSFILILLFLCTYVFSAPPKTEVQLRERRTELKKIEADLAKRRKQLELLKSEEKSVISTLSILDQNLGKTQEYLSALEKNEKSVTLELNRLGLELDSLDREIKKLRQAMKKRIRLLYQRGEHGQAEVLYQLLVQKDNPERMIYMVHRLLSADKLRINVLERTLQEYNSKKKQESAHLNELKILQQKKTMEQASLKEQIDGQQTMLLSLKNDQAMQQKALKEYEKNQKTMLSLIKKLEEKRKREQAEAKRKKEEKKKKKEEKKPEPKPVVKEPSLVYPKCLPLNGEILSQYGFQEHPVLHIRTKNLGVEIRGKKGAKVKAAAHGTVALVSEIDGRGPSVIIEHPDGFFSVYGHLEKILVKEGDAVTNCQEIGIVGDVASLNGIKLYFQVSAGIEPLDPLQWVKSK